MKERSGTCVMCGSPFVAQNSRGPVPAMCPEHQGNFKYRSWVARHPGVPHPDFSPRSCEICSTSLDGKLAGATTCSGRCRAAQIRRRDPALANAKARAWQATSRGKAYQRAYRQANAAKRQAWARASRARDPQRYRGYWRRWADENPELVQLGSLLRAERVEGNPDNAEVTARDIRRLIDRYRGCCAYCGNPARPLHLDHVIPVARGGRTSIGNLVPACAKCNQEKWATLLSVWRLRCRTAI